MKYLISILIFFFFHFLTFAQDSSLLRSLEIIMQKESMNGPTIYVDSFKFDSFLLYRAKQAFPKSKICGVLRGTENNCLYFTKKERNFILSEWKINFNYVWKDNSFIASKQMSSDSIKMILSDTSKGWRYFRKNVSRYYFRISKPMYLRNTTIAIIYYIRYCGNGCWEDKFMVFKNFENIWKLWFIPYWGTT